MASDCESVSIKYQGNGTKQNFEYPFIYMESADIIAFIYNEDYNRWEDQAGRFNFADPTTIHFFVAPPKPTEDIANVWISRKTDLDQMLKEFFPGSAIRAQDLNDNYDQLRLALQEGRCSVEDLLNETVQMTDALTSFDQKSGAWVEYDDEKLATSDAIRARHDAYIGDSKPVKPEYEQPGKNWQNTEKCYSTYWNNQANSWVAYVNTGPRGKPGQDGSDANVEVGETFTGDPGTEAIVVDTGSQGNVILNFTIPRGDKGDKGDGLFITGYIDVPGPPIGDGDSQGDVIVDVNGIGWFWQTDEPPSSWVSLGTIRGPEGQPGAPGAPGDAGDAATIAVGSTTTGAPGSEASVVNSGTSSQAVFNFTIPRGEKGEPGVDGLGTIRSIRAAAPITVDTSVDANSPLIGIDISLLPTLP